MSCDLVASILDGCLDDILSIRSDIGASLYPVFIVTRTWTGNQIGEGTMTDVVVEILPTPRIVDYSHNVNVMKAGAILQGDLLIKMISKASYPLAASINCQVDSNKIETFYRINENDYRVISIKENLLTWDVQIRRLTDQTRG